MKAEIEIIAGWDAFTPFAVHQWSAGRDSGALLETFRTRRQAVRYALAYARRHDMDLHSAPVLPFSGRATA